MGLCVEKLNSPPLLERLKNITVHIIKASLSPSKSYLHHRGMPSPKASNSYNKVTYLYHGFKSEVGLRCSQLFHHELQLVQAQPTVTAHVVPEKW